ncbi:hypothetical protein HLH34_15890 [Gluconacetobacter azotocaptans]|uniref:OmpA-like domain-containing protein n=1 Tax=Gluconacetobacter azotocaptans TaxID=142834 RepID=A0A7W4JV12_9PROT|nr:hypothetical protein [Gluconacetobacter azotocaptans]MBB2191419.1 hypothetical protein [Gluconacetobacter azotocaptans]
MTAPLPRERSARADTRRAVRAGRAAPTLALLLLAGCGHRDAFDATLDWWHQYEGGVIAQQRPPPPGIHDPYPAVGLTPTTPPAVPSAALRQSITENLVEQRNLAHRQAVEIGPLTVTAPGTPPGAAKGGPARPAPPAGPEQPSATLEAAERPPQAAPTPTAPTTSAPPARATRTDEAPAAMPEVAMPEVGADVGGVGGPAVQAAAPPDVAARPPAPPRFPGFAVPEDGALATPERPAYDLADPQGTRIRFLTASDQPVRGQDRPLAELAGQRGTRPIFVHGYGEATSTDPAEQARSMSLALLRAQTVADLLAARGVPANMIHLRAHPFGDGVRVSLNQ